MVIAVDELNFDFLVATVKFHETGERMAVA